MMSVAPAGKARLWAGRLVLAALVLGIVGQRIGAAKPYDPRIGLYARTGAALRAAGYTVEDRVESWRVDETDGEVKGAHFLLAHHADCALPVMVRLSGVRNPPPARRGVPQVYSYGGEPGPAPGNIGFVRAGLAMAWNHIGNRAGTPPPTANMLAIVDPSACLAITAVDWRNIWYGAGAAARSAS